MLANKRTKSYVCIDLKSFYASVECVDRGLDPFTENLVVADPDRGSGTICLAITPAMKALGVKNRCRIFQIPNGIEYTMATPRMARYMEVSAQINALYLRYVSTEDIHVYSIDECFIDTTPYLKLYRMGAKAFAEMLRNKVTEETGITATAGIGPNLFLAKVALDIEAKKAADGIGILDEESYKREIWFHRPITDIWQVGLGIAHRLATRHPRYGGRMRGEPRMAEKGIRQKRRIPARPRLGAGALHHQADKRVPPRSAFDIERAGADARLFFQRSTHRTAGNGRRQLLSCGNVSVHVGYAQPHLTESGRWGMGSGGSTKLSERTDSPHRIVKVALELFDKHTLNSEPIRRLTVALGALQPTKYDQPSLFSSEDDGKEADLAKASIAVRDRFGKNALLRGTSLKQGATMRERNNQIGGHRA